ARRPRKRRASALAARLYGSFQSEPGPQSYLPPRRVLWLSTSVFTTLGGGTEDLCRCQRRKISLFGRERGELVPQHAHVREVPVALAVVEPVADHEAVRNLEADVADRDLDRAPLRFRQQGADLERLRLPRAQVPHQVREGEARV